MQHLEKVQLWSPDLFGNCFSVGHFIKSLLFIFFIGRCCGIVVLAYTPHPLITLRWDGIDKGIYINYVFCLIYSPSVECREVWIVCFIMQHNPCLESPFMCPVCPKPTCSQCKIAYYTTSGKKLNAPVHNLLVCSPNWKPMSGLFIGEEFYSLTAYTHLFIKTIFKSFFAEIACFWNLCSLRDM